MVQSIPVVLQHWLDKYSLQVLTYKEEAKLRTDLELP